MRLLSIELRNFRQFAGEQVLEFAESDEQNVTLVYGPNGGGKTTLLNAFVWALYGSFTPDFEQPEMLIHADTWSSTPEGAQVDAGVSLRFAHDDRRYEIERRVAVKKTEAVQRIQDTGGSVRLFVTDERGLTSERENPVDHILRLLPEELHKFFFFNGERIENLTRHSAYKELAGATKTLLGLEVMTRAIQHLPRAAKSYQSELAKLGDSHSRDTQEKLRRVEDELSELGEQLAAAVENDQALEDQREAVFAELERHSESRALQVRRAAAIDRRMKAESSERQALAELRRVISSHGFLAFTEKLGGTVEDRFADLEARGELPAPIKEPFVRELLEQEKCICGSPLHEGSDARGHIEQFLSTAGSPELESLWTRLDGSAKRMPQDRIELSERITATLRARDSSGSERRAAIEAESEVERLLEGVENIDVQALEDRQQGIHREMRQTSEKIGKLKSDGKRLDAQQSALTHELETSAKADARSQEVQRCLQVAREARETLETVQAILTDGVRVELNRRIRDTYGRISARPRDPELSAEFELRLWENDGKGGRRLAPNSTSENTILALSFVGGLVAYARDQEQGAFEDPILARLLGGMGGTYPIVIDAAFGNLDETYRLEVARALPLLASHLVVLLSKSQAHGTVGELTSHVGRRYVMVSHVAKEDQNEDLEIDGRAIPYRRSCALGEERTEIVEV